jgi:hypothetical protein
VFELDAIGLVAAAKLDGIPVDEGHIPQIQDPLPRCLDDEQFLKLHGVLGRLDSDAEHENTCRLSFR